MTPVLTDFLVNLLKLILAIGIGAIIGIERERSGKPVGVRTLAMVCAGSALVMMISIEHFAIDTSRVVQGIITGIGFLGAGAIIAHGDHVKGLTTAASIWAISIIGVGIGIGDLVLSGTAAILFYLILVLGKLEHRLVTPEGNEKQKKR